MGVPVNLASEVPQTKICDLGDPFSRVGAKLADPEFRKEIATKDPLNVLYRAALSAVNRLAVLGGYDCLRDKPFEGGTPGEQTVPAESQASADRADEGSTTGVEAASG